MSDLTPLYRYASYAAGPKHRKAFRLSLEHHFSTLEPKAREHLEARCLGTGAGATLPPHSRHFARGLTKEGLNVVRKLLDIFNKVNQEKADGKLPQDTDLSVALDSSAGGNDHF